jgi:hypothetical protein
MVSGKAQVSLDFEINKYQYQLAINNKTVKLEEKNFMRSSWLEEKKWVQELKMDEKRLEWEKDEKERDQTCKRQAVASKRRAAASKQRGGSKIKQVADWLQEAGGKSG